MASRAKSASPNGGAARSTPRSSKMSRPQSSPMGKSKQNKQLSPPPTTQFLPNVNRAKTISVPTITTLDAETTGRPAGKKKAPVPAPGGGIPNSNELMRLKAEVQVRCAAPLLSLAALRGAAD